MVGMAARVDIASAAVVANANSAQKITTTKVQIVGSSTGSTATKELPCTKNRKSNTPIGWVISHIGPPEFPFWILFSFDSVWSALFFDEFFVNLFW